MERGAPLFPEPPKRHRIHGGLRTERQEHLFTWLGVLSGKVPRKVGRELDYLPFQSSGWKLEWPTTALIRRIGPFRG